MEDLTWSEKKKVKLSLLADGIIFYTENPKNLENISRINKQFQQGYRIQDKT